MFVRNVKTTILKKIPLDHRHIYAAKNVVILGNGYRQEINKI